MKSIVVGKGRGVEWDVEGVERNGFDGWNEVSSRSRLRSWWWILELV